MKKLIFRVILTIIYSILLQKNDAIEIEKDATMELQCYCCDSATESACTSVSQRSFSKFICKCSDACAVSYNSGSFFRNCVSDIFQKPFEKIVQICDTELCNTAIALVLGEKPSDDLEAKRNATHLLRDEDDLADIGNIDMPLNLCYRCNSSENYQCFTNPIGLQSKTNCPGYCFTGKFGDTLLRGCADSLNEHDTKRCEDSRSCRMCKENNCNFHDWAHCYVCESSPDDPNCAQWFDSSKVPYDVCGKADDKCLIEINSQYQTIRKCISSNEVECSDNAMLCDICSDSLCNAGVYPANRRQCHQCNDSAHCMLEQEKNQMRPCLLYSKEDSCFQFVQQRNMVRSCVSDAARYSECDAPSDTCRICHNENGCNSVPYYRSPSLSCSVCDKSTECAWYQESRTVKKCSKNFLYFLKETCMTYTYNSTGEAERGCTFDKGDCPSENCHKCATTGCNVKNVIYQSCYQCNSSVDGEEECANVVEELQPELCQAEVQPFATRGCYILTKDKTVIRGCACDLSDRELKLCQSDRNSSCSYCPEMQCNNKKPNAANIPFNTFSGVSVISLIILMSSY